MRFEFGRALQERLTKQELLREPALQDLTILRAPQGTNYSLTEEQVGAIERLLESRNLPDYFKIAPGVGGEFWDECLEDGIICVGWDELGDLREFESAEELRTSVEQRYGAEMRNNPATITYTARRLWDLRQLKPGDRVVANRGVKEVLGVGEVTLGGYQWRADRSQFRHVVNVAWDTEPAGPIPDQGGAWRRTIVPITRELYESIVTGEVASSDPFGCLMADLADAGLYFACETVSNYLLALQTKRFVILTGISGTGKTRLAMHVVRSLGSTNAEDPDERLCVVAVRPDWTDNHGFRGWLNPITNKYMLTPAPGSTAAGQGGI